MLRTSALVHRADARELFLREAQHSMRVCASKHLSTIFSRKAQLLKRVRASMHLSTIISARNAFFIINHFARKRIHH